MENHSSTIVVSPFQDKPIEEWDTIRDKLIKNHPLNLELIKKLILTSWEKLLQTRIGPPQDNIIMFIDIDIPAQVISNFIEVLLSRELRNIDSRWRQGSSSEKDLIYAGNEDYSIEVKCSGQGGTKVFGNRSYAQKTEAQVGKKGKSGYYITINFFDDLLYLIRFGWIDFDDWAGQKAATGQAATLPNDVYEHKLRAIKGDYQLNAPIFTLKGVGPKTMDKIYEYIPEKIRTIKKFVKYCEEDLDRRTLRTVKEINGAYKKARIKANEI